MIRKDVLVSLIQEYQKDLDISGSIPREKKISVRAKFATIISGIRRCGKSVLSKQLVQFKQPVYYFNFENVQLATFEEKDFVKLDSAFQEVLGENGIYLFDEVQNIKGWEIYVRQLVDKNKIVIVTGSNATMLSRELGTRLTGRNLRYELYPFSFNEYLNFKNKRASLETFQEYFVQGGFAEYVESLDADILRNLFQDIFYRDILVRHDVRLESQLKQFVAHVCANIGVETSYSKLQKLLQLGSHNTISQFILACEQAYLFFQVSKFDYSVKKQIIAPKKLYCVDNAILKLNSFSFSNNTGRFLENIVFMHLKRQNKDIYYHRFNFECDFVIKEGSKIIDAVQVCYKLDDDNEIRELKGLVEACKNYNLSEGLLITYDQEDSFEIEGIKIYVRPVWKLLHKNE